MQLVEPATAWAIASVFIAAAAGKALPPSTAAGRTLAIGEGLLAPVLMSGLVLLISALAAVGVVAGFAVRALGARQDARCNCFGAKLPHTGRAGQRVRNLALLGLAVMHPWSVVQWPRATPSMASATFGMVVGGALVGFPG